MSRSSKVFVVACAVLCLAGMIGLTRSATPRETSRTSSAAALGPRIISLEARGMAFYIADTAERNPVLRVRAGEEVRIVFSNRDRGLAHDFVIPSLNVGISTINSEGQDEVVFRAPTTAGRYQYVCRPHAAMMNGFIEVENR
jgi:plastocyanin